MGRARMYEFEFARDVLVSEDDISAYRRDGYLILPSMLTRNSLDLLAEKGAPFGEAPDFPVVLNIHRKQRVFGELMLHEKMLAMLKAVHGCDCDGLNSQYFFKKPGSKYAMQSWRPHQDNAYPKAARGAYTVVHLTIDKNSQENGGLVFWKGSHVEPILDYDYKKSWRETPDEDGIARPGWMILNMPDKYERVELDMPEGSLCVMHGHLIHGSSVNYSQSMTRRQYSMAYLTQNSHYLEGVTSVKKPFRRTDLNEMPAEATEFDPN